MKSKAKRQPRRPNVFEHMMMWGIISGILMGALYAFMLYLPVLPVPSFVSITSIIAGMMLWCGFGAIFGLIFGTLLGLLDVLLLYGILPRDSYRLMQCKPLILASIFIITTIACGPLTYFILGAFSLFMENENLIWQHGIPLSLIAGTVATFATNRYLKRVLSQYAGKPKGKN